MEAVTGELLPPDDRAQELAAQQAQHAHERIRRHVSTLRGLWVDLAGELYTFTRLRLWKDLGYSSFEEYLEQPEIELRRRWVYDNIAIYQQLVIDRQVDPGRLRDIQVSKIKEVLPAIRRGIVSIDAGLSDAGALSRADLEVRYRGLASSQPGRADTSSTVETDFEPEPERGPASSEARSELELQYPAPEDRVQRDQPALVQCPTCGGRGTVVADE